MHSLNYLEQPFSVNHAGKKAFFAPEMQQLIKFHYKNCDAYKNIVDIIFPDFYHDSCAGLEQLPFIPVSLFKHELLQSVAQKDVFKTLSSSGTTSQQPSKIVLDRETAQLQSKILVSIVGNFIGKQRLPMIIVDQQSTISNRLAFNARAAGIIGFSGFGRDHLYLLDENMAIKEAELRHFLDVHKHEQILVFGFTFMIWKYFYQACLAKKIDADLNRGIVIHGGGWKKIKDEAVSAAEFKQKLIQKFNIKAVHNYYGFIEQVGSIFMECEAGHLHVPIFSEILVRDQHSLQPLAFNKIGLIQSLSVIPKSYPGASVLTEDLGECLGEDDCACGRLGKYFRIIGRLPAAEIRGCSDTH